MKSAQPEVETRHTKTRGATRLLAAGALGVAGLLAALGAIRTLDGGTRDVPTLAVARAAVAADPGDAAAQERLAYAALGAEGVTREALAALLAAYEAEPFPPPARMTWRVELAGAYWPAMPDGVQAATLSQVEALGRVPRAWGVREGWCRHHPAPAIGEAACLTVPGVDRRWDLRREGQPGDPDVTGSRAAR